MRDGERFTIRRRLAGLTLDDVGELLKINTDRGAGRELAATVLGTPDPLRSIDDLRDALRTALNKGPDLRVVREELLDGELVPGRAGRAVRWTRIILGITLREWTEIGGHSTGYWSVFEREEDRATRALERGSIGERELALIGDRMYQAAVRLGELFPSKALPLRGGRR